MNEIANFNNGENLIWDTALDHCEAAAIIFNPQENRIYQYNKRMVRLYGQPGIELVKNIELQTSFLNKSQN